MPLVITLEKDTASFHVLNRVVAGNVLSFEKDTASGNLKDINTQSTWTLNGDCIEGTLKGQRLQRLQAYQEFWHSWQSFHPNTLQ